MEIVLDTNVIVAGLRSRDGSSFQILSALLDRRITPLISVALLLEYEAVLKRDTLITAFADPSDADVFLDVLASFAKQVTPRFRWRPMQPDPADDMVVEAAVAGRAEAIVTFNVRDFAEVRGQFGIPVWLPRQCLHKLREKQS